MKSDLASPQNPEWYAVENNTAMLVKAVLNHFRFRSLTGDDIWNLMRLTWITAHHHRVVDHWKTLKVPALEALFRTVAHQHSNLDEALGSMSLPRDVSNAANLQTGFSNAYRVYRNSARKWCAANVRSIRALLNSASNLSYSDDERISLAGTIAELSRIPAPAGQQLMAAKNYLTPLVACIDPLSRFPIVNGESGVSKKLRALGASQSSLPEQVQGLLGLLGQFGIADAFALDTFDGPISGQERQHLLTSISIDRRSKRPQRNFDEAERISIQESRTVIYRKRHNLMTNRLLAMFPEARFVRASSRNCLYDALIADYDHQGRDLLVEAKPDPDLGSVRVAVGQLLDYRRHLHRRALTDLCFLSIRRPSKSLVQFLHELQISTIWFSDETCFSMRGCGRAWESLCVQLKAK